MTTELSVRKMTCGHCVGAVTRAVKSVDPSATVEVDLQSGRVRVGGSGTPEQLVKAIEDAGYPAAPLNGCEGSAAPKKNGCCGACS